MFYICICSFVRRFYPNDCLSFSFFFLFLFNYQIVHLVICLNGTSYLLIFMRHMPLSGFSSSVNPNNIIDTLILYYIHVLFKTPVGSSVSWDTAHMWFCGLSPSERNSLLFFMERVIFFFYFFFYDISVISLSVLECILCSFYLFFNPCFAFPVVFLVLAPLLFLDLKKRGVSIHISITYLSVWRPQQ